STSTRRSRACSSPSSTRSSPCCATTSLSTSAWTSRARSSPTTTGTDMQGAPSRKFSFEFYPPKTDEGVTKLQGTVRQLAQLKPDFFSCTYGAGGSTQEGTLATVLRIREAGHHAAPHLSCVASTKEQLREVIHRYKAHDIRHIVALR